MGVDSVEPQTLQELGYAVILDIDKNEFLNIPSRMATLPSRGDLYEKLSAQLRTEPSFAQTAETRAACMRQPYKNAAECLHEIVDELRDYFHAILDRLLKAQDKVLGSSSSPTPQQDLDGLSEESKVKAILEQLPEEERPFLQRLLETQHYRFYVEKIRSNT